MSVRPHPKLPGHWIIDCRPMGYKGPRLRETVSGTEIEAIEWERTLMSQHGQRQTVVAPKRISALWPLYIIWCELEVGAAKVRDAKSCWTNHLQNHFGNLQVKTITREKVEDYKKKRAEQYRWGKKEYGTVSKRTITKELTHLSAFITWAVEHNHCEPLPFAIKGFNNKQTKAKKARPLLPEQINLLVECIECRYYLVLLLMTDAGLRVTEALTLKREQVDIENELMFVVGKGDKERLVPITTDRLMAALKARADVTGYLTINPDTKKPYTSIKKALARAAKLSGIDKHVYHHLLRHSFGTLSVVAGADLVSIKEMMGHASLQTTQIYTTLAAQQIKQQGRKLNALLSPHGQGVDNRQSAEKT